MEDANIFKPTFIFQQQAPRGRFRDLFTTEYRFTTIGLWLLWFGTAFSYYGMVLAQSEILEFHKTCGSGECIMVKLCNRTIVELNEKRKIKYLRFETKACNTLKFELDKYLAVS